MVIRICLRGFIPCSIMCLSTVCPAADEHGLVWWNNGMLGCWMLPQPPEYREYCVLPWCASILLSMRCHRDKIKAMTRGAGRRHMGRSCRLTGANSKGRASLPANWRHVVGLVCAKAGDEVAVEKLEVANCPVLRLHLHTQLAHVIS